MPDAPSESQDVSARTHERWHGGCAGASEPRNLGYMERLGLWGEGTPSFAAFQDFLDAVGGRGVGALELVAMDMKARGMFVCRTLSFQGEAAALCCFTRTVVCAPVHSAEG